MDRARRETDRKLKDLERRITSLYASDPSLLRIMEKYQRYMARVRDLTMDDYRAFTKAPYGKDRDRLKKVYTGRLEDLTIKNKRYNDIISEITEILSEINQKSIDLANDEMADIYITNYNQLAVECKRLGIQVDG